MKYVDEGLSNDNELSEDEKELINRIDELEQDYARILKLDFKSQELFNKKILKKKVKIIKQKLRVSQKELDDKFDYEGSIYNNISYSIIKLDYLFKSDIYSDFYKIKIEKNPKKRLKLYRRVYTALIEDYNSLDKYDHKNRKVTKNIIDLIKQKIHKEKTKIKRTIESEPIKDIKPEIKTSIPDKKIEEPVQYLDLTNNYALKYANLVEVMNSFKNMIKNSPITIDFIDYVSIIRKRLIDEDNLDENYVLINSLIDSIKYRKLYLQKTDKKEKNILRLCFNELKELSDQIYIRSIPVAEEHDYKFELLFELLRDKKNYQLIRKMVNDYPAIVNVRNNRRSIMSYILQLYINNYMSILSNQNYGYNVDYLKEVYKLFASSSSLYLTIEDKMELESILDEFVYKISELDINSKEKNSVINEIKELYLNNMNNDNSYCKRINKDLLDSNIKEMLFLDANHSKKATEIDLTSENTFMLENPYTCYSFTEGKGTKSLKIHTTDISNIVEYGSEIEKYIYNCLIDNKKINSTLSDYLEFKKDDIVSAFTYEIVMDNDRNVKDFKIYRSRIKVDGGILDYSNNQYVYQTLRRIVNDYIQEYGDVKLTGLSKIEYILNDLLKKQYIKLSRNNNLPIITSKENEYDSIDLETFSRIQSSLRKLNKRDFKKLSKIFESKIEEKY